MRRPAITGLAPIIKYDEAKEQTIFDGDGGLAKVYRFKGQGVQPEVLQARKIFYLHPKGEFKLEGARGISN